MKDLFLEAVKTGQINVVKEPIAQNKADPTALVLKKKG